MDPLGSISLIAGSGMRAQTERMRVIAENVANADVTGTSPGADPYRRKTVTFGQMIDPGTGSELVRVDRVGRDMSEFPVRYDPAHPAADEAGFVKRSNVSSIIEMSNMREATRSYEANMAMFEAGRGMRSRLLDMLR
ncbi:MAG: flagellar basal body rod protein FlgC [Myxococcales bacterium]|jgi:flagellar basal-body rod protein FlgC|nr:flagellar basal body rod protein FlgC [Myxococcales bacterium]